MRQDPYRSIARWYDRLFEPLNQGLRVLGLRLFLPTSAMTILDVGCGTGLYLEMVRRYQCALYGIDRSPSMLDAARIRLGAEAHLHLGDAAGMPFADRSFDLVTSMLALHEMAPATRSAVIVEMKRVLKPGGSMLLIDFHPGPVRPLKGWLTKSTIFAAEVAAGREHFRNYRQFMAIKGLPTLITQHALAVKKQRIVGGGALALFLLGVE